MKSIFRRRPETYSENANLLRWIRDDACNPLNQIANLIDRGQVLDVGCGAGILGRLLGDNRAIQIDGVDPGVPGDHPGLAGYRAFFSCGIEELIERQGIASYDWIVLADVIEHFPYPDELLHLLATHASPACSIIVSTPNVAYITTRLNLLAGRFDYVASGILESTHLRLCTFRTLSDIVRSAGLSLTSAIFLNRLPSIEGDLVGHARRLLLLPLLTETDPCLLTYQFLVVLRKGELPGSSAAVVPTIVGPRGSGELYRALLAHAARRLMRRLTFWR